MSRLQRSSARYAFLLGAIALVALFGCGGGGDESSSGSTAAEAAKPSRSQPNAEPHKQAKQLEHAKQQQGAAPRQKSGQSDGSKPQVGGAAEFETRGGDNSIQRFGGEGSESEVATAAAVLHDYLDARTAGDWSRMCSHLSREVLTSLRSASSGGVVGQQGKPVNCPKTVAALFTAMPEAVAREASVARIGAFRVRGNRGLLLYHGSYGTDYFVAMLSEGGEWKLAALAPSALP
jgi:hypothetical protein